GAGAPRALRRSDDLARNPGARAGSARALEGIPGSNRVAAGRAGRRPAAKAQTPAARAAPASVPVTYTERAEISATETQRSQRDRRRGEAALKTRTAGRMRAGLLDFSSDRQFVSSTAAPRPSLSVASVPRWQIPSARSVDERQLAV